MGSVAAVGWKSHGNCKTVTRTFSGLSKYRDTVGSPRERGRGLPTDRLRTQTVYIHGTSIFVDGGMTLYPGFETGG